MQTPSIISPASGQAWRWRDHLPVHPAADLFPAMSETELKELADDIRKNGLQHPIVIWHNRADWPNGRDQLIDGRNRLDALALLGRLGPHPQSNPNPSGPFAIRNGASALQIAPEVRDRNDKFNIIYHIPDDDAVCRYVIAANLHRRHLSVDDKRDLIAKLLKATPEQSNRAIAKQVKADGKTVAKVRTDLEATAEIPQLEKTAGKDGKKRPARRKAKAATVTAPAAEPAPSVSPDLAESADASAERRKAEYADLDMSQAEKASAKALGEFKFACRQYLPKITIEADRQQVRQMIAELMQDDTTATAGASTRR